jgi:predicted ABC-type ATPase
MATRRSSKDSAKAPRVVIIAGPNGAGKSTSARILLRTLGVSEFINADDIARDMTPDNPDAAALAAGREMLLRIRELAAHRKSFAFETTLASRSFAPWVEKLVQTGYEFHLVYLWLPSPVAAIRRVLKRVEAGGHSVPDETIRRRYFAGLHNFFSLYLPLATAWRMVDNSTEKPQVVAAKDPGRAIKIVNQRLWERIQRIAQHE